jgi:hypothetical protein
MRLLLAVAGAGALAAMFAGETAHAIETIEAVGAEKCGGSVKSYEVEFLAPENASLAGTVKAIVDGRSVAAPNAASLSIDGRECANARCPFEAKKGQTYRFAAASGLPRLDNLCIVVARP